MSDTIPRRNGAVKFTRSIEIASQYCDAAMFSKQNHNDCVDVGWLESINRLDSFFSLTDDWDGNGSIAPNRELIEMAKNLAKELMESSYPSPARVQAGANGTISFEFYEGDLTEIEIVSAREAQQYEAGKLVKTIFAD